VNRDLQFALIERRSLEFRYLLAMHAERIVGTKEFPGLQIMIGLTRTLARSDVLIQPTRLRQSMSRPCSNAATNIPSGLLCKRPTRH
jgi:hypothetical protein